MRGSAAVFLALLLGASATGCGVRTFDEEEVRSAFAAEGIELSIVGRERFTLLSSGEGVEVAVLANESEARSFAEDAEALMGLAEEEGVQGDPRAVVRRLNVVVVHDPGFEDEVEAALGRL